jgi:hypothetical protein
VRAKCGLTLFPMDVSAMICAKHSLFSDYRIEFPVVLDMNPYVERSEDNSEYTPEVKCELVQPVKANEENSPRTSHSRPCASHMKNV